MDPVVYYEVYHISPSEVPPAIYETEIIGGGGYSGADGIGTTEPPGGNGYSCAGGGVEMTVPSGGSGYSGVGGDEMSSFYTVTGHSGEEEYENFSTPVGGGGASDARGYENSGPTSGGYEEPAD